MHPALSVIFFTTLSGAGYGLLAWQGAWLLTAFLRGDPAPELHRFQQGVLAAGLALAVVGLLCSLAHLGKPQRAWRAFSQWRTSWLSREGVLAAATLLPGIALLVALQHPPARHAWLPATLGALLAFGALATVASTAMIYASLRTVPAWRHPLVVPAYLLFALATGHALLFVAIGRWLGTGEAAGMLAILAGYGVVLAATKWVYWHELDRAAPEATRGDAIGLPGRTATVFERPNTEANFITREMAFAVARRHGTALRWLATGLFAAVPLAAALLAAFAPGGGPSAVALPPLAALAAVALALLAGAFVERWLFFAQARHMVTLYY